MKAANNKGADQTARMRRLICIFCSHMSKTGFLMTWLIYPHPHFRQICAASVNRQEKNI